MIIKDRLIEVDVTEALAIAGKGETVRCVGDGTGLIDLADALEGLTFFAPESALTEKPEPVKMCMMCMTPPKAAASYDTPESRTRAIIDSVERYDEEHGDPTTTRQDTEDVKNEAPKQEPPKETEAPKEVPGFVPFASAPSGGGR